MRPERTKATTTEQNTIDKHQRQQRFKSRYSRLTITTIAKLKRRQTGCTRLLQQHLGTNRTIVFLSEQ